MALFDCPECGGKVSDKASLCPHCGCPVEQPQNKSKTCPECGQEVDASVMVCPNCAFPFSVMDKDNTDAMQMDSSERKRPKSRGLLLWIVLLFVAVLAFTYNNKSLLIPPKNNSSTSDSPTEYQSSSNTSSSQSDRYNRREVKRETRTIRANKMEKRGNDWKVCGTVTLTLTIEDGNARVTELNGHRCNLSISASQIDYSDWCCREGSYFYCFDCRF